MPNINKVVFGNTTLIDLSVTTLSTASQLASGITAYDRAGNVITGTGSGGSSYEIVFTQDANGRLILDSTATVLSAVGVSF